MAASRTNSISAAVGPAVLGAAVFAAVIAFVDHPHIVRRAGERAIDVVRPASSLIGDRSLSMAASAESALDHLAGRVLDHVDAASGTRVMIAIAGVPGARAHSRRWQPGSGKTTLADGLSRTIDAASIARGHGPCTAVVTLDGWHYPWVRRGRWRQPCRPWHVSGSCSPGALTAQNASEAHARRGAHWTFDAAGYSDFICAVRAAAPRERDYRSLPVLAAPRFSHAEKDPVALAVPITEVHKVIIVEGLYTHLDIGPWADASSAADERVLVTIDRARQRDRLAHRHLAAGIVSSLEAGYERGMLRSGR